MPEAYEYAHLDLIETPVFVLEIAADRRPVYVGFNAFALKVAGKARADFLDRTALEAYPQPFGRVAYERHCTVRDTGVPLTYQLDLPLGGMTRTVRTTLHPKKNASGQVTHLFGTSVDLTRERAAEEAKVQFETVAKEMEQFVAMAAHDLRGPMRNVAAIAELLADDFTDADDDTSELITSLEKISTKSMDLISEVLSHVEIVGIQDQKTAFDLGALCRDIWLTLDPIGRHALTTCDTMLGADRTTMQIVQRNLIENGLKHGQRPSIAIGVSAQPGLPGMIDVTIHDDGGGFTPDALKVMNGARFRSESGYGLFTVKRLISARGGQFVARNLPDQRGAVVRFSLPGSCLDAQDALAASLMSHAVQTRPENQPNHRFRA